MSRVVAVESAAAEVVGEVEDEAVLVDAEVDHRAVRPVGHPPLPLVESVVALDGRRDGERLDVDGDDRQLGAVTGVRAGAGGSAACW